MKSCYSHKVKLSINCSWSLNFFRLNAQANKVNFCKSYFTKNKRTYTTHNIIYLFHTYIAHTAYSAKHGTQRNGVAGEMVNYFYLYSFFCAFLRWVCSLYSHHQHNKPTTMYSCGGVFLNGHCRPKRGN